MLKIKYVIPALALAVVLMATEIVIIRSAAKYGQKAEAVFAAEKISRGTLISDSMVKIRSVDADVMHKLAFGRVDEVVGRVARVDMEQDEMILSSKVEEQGTINPVLMQNPDARLYTVEFRADQANGWQLNPGDFVDIIFIPNKTQTQGEASLESLLHSEGLPIGAVRMKDIRVAAIIDDSGNLINGTAKGAMPRYISFEVEKGQDEFLAYAKTCGRLELSVNPAKARGKD